MIKITKEKHREMIRKLRYLEYYYRQNKIKGINLPKDLEEKIHSFIRANRLDLIIKAKKCLNPNKVKMRKDNWNELVEFAVYSDNLKSNLNNP